MQIHTKHDELVPVRVLKPHPRNPNVHTPEQLDRLAKIIDKLGFRSPVVVSRRSGHIVVGHGRVEAAKRLGMEKVPVNYQNYATEEEEYQHLVGDNAIAEWAALDLGKINSDIGDLGPFDIELLGLKDFEVEPLDKLGSDANEDSVPEAPAEAESKRGEIYKLGEHRLMCGDATDSNDVALLMDGAKADMVFTDPPYGMDLDTDYSKLPLTEKVKREKGIVNQNTYRKIEGDNVEFDPSHLFSLSNEVFLWGADYYADKILKGGSWVVWDKRCDEKFDKAIGSSFELCWSLKKHKRDIVRVRWVGAFGTETQDIKKRIHPTQKPIQLAEWFFDKWGKDKINIADLYGGSGSTLIACEKTKRKCYMLEIDPLYCDIIKQRWSDYTNQKWELVNAEKKDSI